MLLMECVARMCNSEKTTRKILGVIVMVTVYHQLYSNSKTQCLKCRAFFFIFMNIEQADMRMTREIKGHKARLILFYFVPPHTHAHAHPYSYPWLCHTSVFAGLSHKKKSCFLVT